MTENELLDALREAEGDTPDTPDAYTLTELAEITGRPKSWLEPRLRVAVKAGTVVPVMAQRTNLWGASQGRPAYRFVRAA